MKPGDKVIYFQPKGFDTPVHRTATITGLTESQIDGKRAFILIDPTDPEDLPFRDWVRQSSLQPYSDALFDVWGISEDHPHCLHDCSPGSQSRQQRFGKPEILVSSVSQSIRCQAREDTAGVVLRKQKTRHKQGRVFCAN